VPVGIHPSRVGRVCSQLLNLFKETERRAMWPPRSLSMTTMTRTIIVSIRDRERLEGLITAAQAQGSQRPEYLEALRGELERARTVKPAQVPPDVITMNSTVRLRDLDTGETETYTLVYPNDADASAGRISVLAPIGTAILGYRVGDTITWRVPAGLRRLKVVAVPYQPERAGEYHL
jgi:regulator of nucleoside diphosphate kinase